MTGYDKDRDDYAAIGGFGAMLGHAAYAVEPSDSEDFVDYPKAVLAASEGNVKVIPLMSDDPVELMDVPAGYVIPFRVRRVMIAANPAAKVVAIL